MLSYGAGLNKKNILLGITGSIAAYKSIDIVKGLTKEGAVVTVVMTDAACRFVSPVVLESESGRRVHTDLFAEGSLREDYFSHINLAKESQLFIIAPATANTISKLACGIADNLLTAVWLAYKGTALIAPAMNWRMYENPLVKKNIGELKKYGVTFIGPEYGSLACGEEGIGRMAEPEDIVEAAKAALVPKDMSGHKILVTAGPTREALDPVRFISNRSSGKMGYAIAKAALRRGADVTLVSGPSSLQTPEDVSFISVESASEMKNEVLKHFSNSTSVIMASAVSDFSPASQSKTKIKKADTMTINLKKTPDILAELGRKKGKRFLVGFAAETGRNIANAKNKLKEKNLDLIVMNDVTAKGAGFDSDTNIVTIINKKGKVTDYPLMKKEDVADIILDWLLKLSHKRN
ncbi:MAG: bifunctional phosphopantothenoylcysteine decarboxylase/phosphopantothenate--cysteine ligase CoaBC [Nitrospirae bacterium]|nr:bifunctional phosphopantothenoylcysteine decarboxylase/phosphopantothenate--cysteine ligase CoaBC [Nitrospirota bacterium]